jgi:hypothetical protein
VAVILGWMVVAALVAVGLAGSPDAPRTVVAGSPSHRTAPASTPGTPSADAGGLAVSHTPRSNSPHRPVSKLAATSNVAEFASSPPSCSRRQDCSHRGCQQSVHGAAAIVFGSVRAAFNSDGIAPPKDASAGNFDCRGFSFQAQLLAADGFEPGAQVAADGHLLTLPRVVTGAPDEIMAEGQVIKLNPAHRTGVSELGLLGAGEFGTQAGTLTISYTDGSKRTAALRLADWYADAPVAGSVTATAALWNVPTAHASAYGPAPVSVYYTQIRIDPAKTIESVTLPRNPNLHFFDIGLAVAATYPSVSSAYNDIGLAPATAAREGNFDGAGHSYNSAALAARGLRSGASVTAQGVEYTWPHFGPGHFDNIRAEGQTINVRGTGRVLGFLGAATLGTGGGLVRIHYTDGSTQSATVRFADWRASRPAAGGKVVATVPWNQVAGHSHRQVSVYSVTVPLETGKTVASVTLPVNFTLHVFAIAEGT